MKLQSINFTQKLELFAERWQPKVIAEMNDYQFKLVKLAGDFVWHDHKDTDETFIVLEGILRIDFRSGAVHIAEGEMFVVPKGVEHKPYAENEVHLLLIESSLLRIGIVILGLRRRDDGTIVFALGGANWRGGHCSDQTGRGIHIAPQSNPLPP